MESRTLFDHRSHRRAGAERPAHAARERHGLGDADLRPDVVAARGLEDGVQQAGESGLQVGAAQLDEAAGAFLARPGDPGVAHCAASKAALEQLTRTWALELAPDGVRVNALAPGPTESEALSAAGLPASAVDQIKADEAARVPLGRRGEPGEVATWIVRLADPSTTWLTGQVLTMDGGLDLT